MKPKSNAIRRKSFVILALVAVLFVLHALVTSNEAMAERVFTDTIAEVTMTPVSEETTVGQDFADGLYNFIAFTGFKNATRAAIISVQQTVQVTTGRTQARAH